ncbi:MAG: hypothetical protein RLY78_354 [Pseudomonadota bacterium]
MEEWIGHWWHRLVTAGAERGRRHPQAAVTLAEMRPQLGLMFRAFGGEPAARLAEASAQPVGQGRVARGWLQRVAGSGTRASLASLVAWQGSSAADRAAAGAAAAAGPVLCLPPDLAVHPDRTLNRQLYVWLAAVAAAWPQAGALLAEQPEPADDDPDRPHGRAGSPGWLALNLAAGLQVRRTLPGLADSHRALLQAELDRRPPAGDDPAEQAVQAALRAGLEPADTAAFLARAVEVPRVDPADVAPVWCWLAVAPPVADAPAAATAPGADADRPPSAADAPDARRHAARRIADERGRAPLILPFRAESLLTFGDPMRIDRADDDTPDDSARTAAADLDHLSLAPDGRACASRVRFDLDLPSAAADDLPIGPGEPLPEWDWRRGRLQPDHCRAQTFVAPPQAQAWQPPPALQATARRLRRQLEALRAAPHWQRACTQGERIDLDAWVRHQAGEGARAAVPARGEPAVYARQVRSGPDLATLLLADLSLSTDAWVKGDAATGRPDQRVIDIVRDALYVFGEALSARGDAFEMTGFSSVRRQQVRLHRLKGFDERWGALPCARVGAIRPGYYTRMGAAIRHATRRLQQRPERQRLLLLLTDGKPNDLDVYEGRYGLEDTREAVREARAAGLTPFAVTIDPQAADYLPHLFGQHGHARVLRPAELVGRLAQLQAQLVR